MVQSQSLSTLTICGSVQDYSSWRNRVKFVKSPGLIGDRCVSCQFFSRSSSLRGHWKSVKQRNMVRVEARWPFQGGDQGLDPNSERSESANEDILIFFFQLDLATRVQVRKIIVAVLTTVNDLSFGVTVCFEYGAVRHSAATQRKAN